MNTRINALNARQQTTSASQTQSNSPVDTKTSLAKLANLKNAIQAQRTNSSTPKPFDPLNQFFAVSKRTQSAESSINIAEKKKGVLLKTNGDPDEISTADKQIKTGESLFAFLQGREEFWWEETKMATPPKDSPEFKLTNDLREGIARLEHQIEAGILEGSTYTGIEKHQLDLVSSNLSNGNLQEAMKFLNANPKDLADIPPLAFGYAGTVPEPAGQAQNTSEKSSKYKQASAVTANKLSQATDPISKAQLKKQGVTQKELSSFFGAMAQFWRKEQGRTELPPNDYRRDVIDHIRQYSSDAQDKVESIAVDPQSSKKDVLNMNKLKAQLATIGSLLGSNEGLSNNTKNLDQVLKLIKNNPL